MVLKCKYHVRDIAFLPDTVVWKLKGVYEIEFDDGEIIKMASRHIKLSWPYWALTRKYKHIPIDSKLSYKYGELSTDAKHQDMMSHMFSIGMEHHLNREQICDVLGDNTYTDAYNNTIVHLLSYINTVDIDTFREILAHPNMKTVNELRERYPTGYDEEGVDKLELAYQLIEEIFDDPKMIHNIAILSIHDKTIKRDQVLQAFIRGKTSAMDSKVYSNQVWEGFFTGLYNPANRLKESESPTRSHLYNKGNIADAEYTSRKFQLITNVLTNFVLGDCNTNYYHRHTFTDDKMSKNDYNAMVGMNYRLEGEVEWKPFVKGAFSKIVNRPLEFRSTMCCELLSDGKVCSKCFGDLAYNMSEGTAPAHVAATSTTEKSSQGILSTKHLDFIRKVLAIILTSHMSAWVRVYKHSSIKGLMLNKIPPNGKTWKDYKLYINESMYSELSQLAYCTDISVIDTSLLPDMSSLTFALLDDNDNVMYEETVDVKMGVNSSFSNQFLRHFLQNKNNIIKGKKNSVYIPLKGWNYNEPILVYTNKSESMAEFVAAMEIKIRSASPNGEDRSVKFNNKKGSISGSNITSRTTKDSKGKTKSEDLFSQKGSTEQECTDAMFDVFRFINRKLKGVPMTHIATILAVSRIEGPNNSYPAVGFDLMTANDATGKRFVKHNDLMGMRSASAMLFFEGQQKYLNDVEFYVDRVRPPSLYDGAFKTLPE